MTRIDSNARTIRQLLAGTKYQLDYYQREYSWQAKHITELLDDLSRIFLESYTEGCSAYAYLDHNFAKLR